MKGFFQYSLILLAFAGSLNAQNALFLAQGANDTGEWWMQPGTSFYDTLAPEASAKNYEIIPFSWGQLPEPLGGIWYTDMLDDAKALAFQIIDKKAAGAEKISIIAHSNGGHMAQIASQLLDPNSTGSLVFLGFKAAVQLRAFFKGISCTEGIIDRLYTLGTQNSEGKPEALPHKTINTVIHLYSEEDETDPYGYKLTITDPNGPTQVNIEAKRVDTAGNPIATTHADYITPEVARAILSLEELSGFSYTNNGIITFSQDSNVEPVYQINPDPVIDNNSLNIFPITSLMDLINLLSLQ